MSLSITGLNMGWCFRVCILIYPSSLVLVLSLCSGVCLIFGGGCLYYPSHIVCYCGVRFSW